MKDCYTIAITSNDYYFYHLDIELSFVGMRYGIFVLSDIKCVLIIFGTETLVTWFDLKRFCTISDDYYYFMLLVIYSFNIPIVSHLSNALENVSLFLNNLLDFNLIKIQHVNNVIVDAAGFSSIEKCAHHISFKQFAFFINTFQGIHTLLKTL